LPIQPNSPPDSDVVLAVKAWNMMDAKIDWVALPVVTELLGITDIECLILQLETIKEHGRQRS
jgi:hypothetical protein